MMSSGFKGQQIVFISLFAISLEFIELNHET